MEYFDIVDETGRPTGRVVSREEAHLLGLCHRTSHIWVLRWKNVRWQVLLQKRSEEKDSFPGCWDCSSAGHIPAGSDFVPSALRELQEELGVTASTKDLLFCGRRHSRYAGRFHGKAFLDDEVTNVYALFLDRAAEDFVIQKEELSCVRWFDLEDTLRAIPAGSIPHCVYPQELKLVQETIEKIREA